MIVYSRKPYNDPRIITKNNPNVLRSQKWWMRILIRLDLISVLA